MNQFVFENINISVVDVFPIGHKIWNIDFPSGCWLFCRMKTTKESWNNEIDPSSVIAFFFPEADELRETLKIARIQYNIESYSDMLNKVTKIKVRKDREKIEKMIEILKKYI